MSEYIIVTDSTADLPAAIIKEKEIQVMSLSFFIDDKEYLDTPQHDQMPLKDFYDYQRANKKTTTAALNPNDVYDFVKPYIESGKDVLYITFSSKLSVTYTNARTASENLAKEFPDNKLVVIDSLSACMGQGLLVYLAADKKQEGLSIDELEEWALAARSHICHWFTVNDLFHLKRGGRVSAASAVIGSALSIKPVLHVDDDGYLKNVSKVRGRRQSLDELVKKLDETGIDVKNQTIFISHGDALDDAEYLADQIRKKYKPKKILIDYVGPVIGSHTGAGPVAVFFLGSKR